MNGETGRYLIVTRNTVLMDAHIVGRRTLWPDAVALAQAHMPNPANYRRFASVTVHLDDPASTALYTRTGEA